MQHEAVIKIVRASAKDLASDYEAVCRLLAERKAERQRGQGPRDAVRAAQAILDEAA
jgi:hypothetical protein